MRLEDARIRAIAKELSAGQHTVAWIADHFGVSRPTVYKIKNGNLRAADPPAATLIAPPLVRALRESVAAMELTDRDKAVIELAETYAWRIHETQAIARDLAECALDARMDPDICGDPDVRRRLADLAKRVESVTVLADLGPKLLAALESLGASPKAAAAIAGKKPAEAAPPPAQTALEQMRARRGIR